MKIRLFVCSICLISCCQFVSAQDASPVDLKELAATLKQIKEKRAAAEKTVAARVFQDFRSAASSNANAIAFYQQAVGATQYDGKAHDHSEFQNWLKDNADKLKSDAMQNAARLHLNYLLLTLQRAGGATTKQLEPALLAHIAAVTAAGAGDDAIVARRDKAQTLRDLNNTRPPRGAKKQDQEPLFWEQDLISKGIESSIFVQWYGISKMLADLKDWESCPGNTDGMYEKTLLPYYRQNKDQRVVAYWDDKIQREAQKAANSALAFKADLFNKVTCPQLLWKQAQDMDAIGQHNRAMSKMIALVKSYPDHPDLPDWIAALEKMLPASPAAPATPGQAAAPSSPAPAVVPGT